MCDDREHNSLRPTRWNVAAADSLPVRRLRATLSGEPRVVGPCFRIAELLIESLVMLSQLLHRCDKNWLSQRVIVDLGTKSRH